METVQEFNIRREKGNAKIIEQSFLPYKRFLSIDSQAYSDKAIPLKYKELMGLVGSTVLRCNDCIYYHLIESRKKGASFEEINEALNIALVIGGSIVIPHLRFALEALSEIEKYEKLNKGDFNG